MDSLGPPMSVIGDWLLKDALGGAAFSALSLKSHSAHHIPTFRPVAQLSRQRYNPR
jgi:hypothetical protein